MMPPQEVMLLRGFLATLLLATTCGITTYVTNSDEDTVNNTCRRFNRTFHSCTPLAYMRDYSRYTDLEIFLLDNSYVISNTLILNFTSSNIIVRPWRDDTLATISCGRGFAVNIQEANSVTLESIQFQQCVNSVAPLVFHRGRRISQMIKIFNAHFVGSNARFIEIYSSVEVLVVTNCSFEDAAKSAIDVHSSHLTNATFQNVLFRNNNVGINGSLLLQTITYSQSSVTLTECVFSNNSEAISWSLLNSLKVLHSKFTENSPQGAIRANNVFNISVFNSMFSNNTANESGGAIRARSTWTTSVLVTINSTFHCNYGSQDGGAVFISGYHGYFNDSTFFGNRAGRSGGSIFRDNKFGQIGIIKCTFYSNEVDDGFGGAIFMASVDNFLMNSSSFENNSATRGGAVQFEGNLIKLNKCYFNNNTATSVGGALNIDANDIDISESNWNSNSALSGDGGAIKSFGCLKIASSTFIFNKAESGGALSVSIYGESWRSSVCSIECKTTIFSGNEAKATSGGAINIIGGQNIIGDFDSCMFIKNRASQNGGAIQCSSFEQLDMFSCNFTENVAPSGGALNILYSRGQLYILHSNFTGNFATEEKGGALYTSLLRMTLSMCSFLGNSARTSGGAISSDVKESILIANSDFMNNSAEVGAGLDVKSPSITVVDSLFTGNAASTNGGALSCRGSIISLRMCKLIRNSAYDKGGAVHIIMASMFTVQYTNFSMNSAKSGGALTVELTQEVRVWKCLFCNNKAEVSGGAISQLEHGNTVYISNSLFFKNSAHYKGGALALDSALDERNSMGACSYDYVSNQNNLTYIEGSEFILNTVSNDTGFGGAISVHGSNQPTKNNCANVRIRSCFFKQNTAANGGGIHSSFSGILAYNITVVENKAKLRGGGISLASAQIYLAKNINFTDNHVSDAESKGGALYVEDQDDNCGWMACSVSWTNNSNINFVRNTAFLGPVLYGGMLDRCISTLGFTRTDLEPVLVNGYRYDLQSYGITSSSVSFCFCSDCTTRSINESLFPGQSFTLNVACVDQLSQPRNECTVRADFYRSAEIQFGQGENKQEISGCGNIEYHTLSDHIGPTVLQVWSDLFCKDSNWSTLFVHITLKPCPLGFQLYGKECQCDERLNNFKDLNCIIKNETLIFRDTGWFSYEEGLVRIHSDCPLSYCLKNTQYISPKDPDAQCAYNRGGILCGGCVANYSVVLGSWKCMDCSHLSRYNFIWLTVLLALAGVVLVVFLLLVKMTVSSGTTNGLILYANILSFSGLLDYRTCSIHPVLRVFLSWINLDLGIEVCYYSGMDVYQKTWLQFVFPFYIWFLVVVIILFCHYSSRVMNLMGMRNIEVLATLFLLSYAKFLKTIVTAFSFTDIMTAQAENVSDPLLPTRVWVYDGSIEYLDGKHLPLFIISLVFLIFLFFPYTLFLTFGHYLQYFPKVKGLNFFRGTFVTVVMDAYHAPYRKSHRYWTGLGLLTRCCLFTIFATTNNIKTNIFWIGAASLLLVCLKVLLLARSSIYHNKFVDFLETFSLLKLLFLTLSFGMGGFCKILTASIVLSMTEFVIVAIFHIQLEMRKYNMIQKWIKLKFQFVRNIFKPLQEKEPNEIVQVPSVSFTELRESLL